MKKYYRDRVRVLLGIMLLLALSIGTHFYNQSTVRPDDEKWKTVLTEEQYNIMRKAGTERPFSSPLNEEKRPGTYYDATGTQALFRSEDKFDSGTGWPSFTKPMSSDVIIEQTDWSLGIPRTEVLSSKDGHHLGHVFTDGPEPNGLRYCMNGLALQFVPDDL